MFATVVAINKMGMSVNQSSDSFKVDTSPPKLIQKPMFLTDYSTNHGFLVQWDRSIIRLHWNFTDEQSPIVRNTISLTTHHEGHTPIEIIDVGTESIVTIPLESTNQLHDGDTYTAVITSCNEAGLCLTSPSEPLLIDSTPPHQGGFSQSLFWNNSLDVSQSYISLEWHGFTDPESGINKFYITVGTTYTNQDLSNGTFVYIPLVDDTDTHSTVIEISELPKQKKLFLSIFAENKAALNSSTSRISVSVLSSGNSGKMTKGTLEIEKHSCDVQFCSNECTCAVVGKHCRFDTSLKCEPLGEHINSSYSNVVVSGGLRGSTLTIIPSSSCLSGYWRQINSLTSTISIIRYEWTMGLTGQSYGEGIFDSNIIPWNDVGQRTEVVHCLPTGKHLDSGKNYTIYVRAWYSYTNYAIFKSNNIMVDLSAPTIRKGAAVNDSDSSCKSDLGFIDWMDTITACWDRVFSERQGKLIYYKVSLGTSMNGDDVYQNTNVGLDTNITLTDINLTHGTKYFFKVTAYNDVGLHSTVTSDGFVVDMDTLTAGIVFNTGHHRDEQYQASTTTFKISWHGFTDSFSGIKSYLVAMTDHLFNKSGLRFNNVGLQTQHTFYGLQLKPGRQYYGVVKAVDAAEHESEDVYSSAKVIDDSAPEGVSCEEYSELEIVTSATNESLSGGINIEHNFTKNAIYKLVGFFQYADSGFAITVTMNRQKTHVPILLSYSLSGEVIFTFLSTLEGIHNVTLEANRPLDGMFYVQLLDCRKIQSTSSAISVEQIGLSTVGVTSLIADFGSGLQRVLVGVGTTLGGFQVRPLIATANGGSVMVETNQPHGSKAYVTVVAENHAGLQSTFYGEPITIDHTGPVFNQIKTVVSQVIGDNATTASVQQFTITTSWNVVDDESGLKACYCVIGREKGLADLQSLWRSHNMADCVSEYLKLSHGNHLFVTVTCINNVELQTKNYSDIQTIVKHCPNATNAKLAFIPLGNAQSLHDVASQLQLKDNVNLQASLDRLQFQWEGFEDSTGTSNYQYRIMSDNDSVTGWIGARQQTMVTWYSDKSLNVGSLYTAEVRAVNHGLMRSAVVKADIIVDNRAPLLTGEPVIISRVQYSTTLDWKNVFHPISEYNPTYSVIVGTKEGYSNIIDVSFITSTELQIDIFDKASDGTDVNEMYITITCTYPTGLMTTYRTTYKII